VNYTVLSIAGALHFLQLPSLVYLVRGTLDLRGDLGRLSAVNRRLFVVFVLAVAFLLLGMGALVALYPEHFLETPLGQRLCWLLAIFWTARALVQTWLRSVWPRDSANRAVYYGLFALYTFLAVCYWCSARAGTAHLASFG
jgi:hypothetical protein